MKKTALLLCAILTAGALTACSGGADAITAVSWAATQEAADRDGAGRDTTETPAAGAEEKSGEAGKSSADTAAGNPFSGRAVKVGYSAAFVLFESVEMAADGSETYVGMNIDIVKAAMEKNGGQVEFMGVLFKSLTAAIQAGQIDFYSGGMAPTAEREKTLDFSKIFLYPRNAIVYRAGDNYPDLNFLKGKKIAYMFGTNYQQVAENVEGVVTVGIQGSPACIEEVKSKRTNACIVDGAGTTEFLKNNEGLKLSLMDKVDDDCSAIGFPKGSPYYETSNNALKEMMENEELDDIITSHLGEQFILDQGNVKRGCAYEIRFY